MTNFCAGKFYRSRVEISKSNFPCVCHFERQLLLSRTVFCEIYTIDSLRVVDKLSVLNLGRYEQRVKAGQTLGTVFSDNVANSDAINVNCPRNIWQIISESGPHVKDRRDYERETLERE